MGVMRGVNSNGILMPEMDTEFPDGTISEHTLLYVNVSPGASPFISMLILSPLCNPAVGSAGETSMAVNADIDGIAVMQIRVTSRILITEYQLKG
jgi:hypothetical protein